jgi:hypothetical protein
MLLRLSTLPSSRPYAALCRNDTNEILSKIFDGHEQMMKIENLNLNAPSRFIINMSQHCSKDPRDGGLHAYAPRVTDIRILRSAQSQKVCKYQEPPSLDPRHSFQMLCRGRHCESDNIKVEGMAVAPNLESDTCKVGDSAVLSYPPS